MSHSFVPCRYPWGEVERRSGWAESVVAVQARRQPRTLCWRILGGQSVRTGPLLMDLGGS